MLVAALPGIGPSFAQGTDCEQLRAAISEAPGNGARDGEAGAYANAMERQRNELDRTRSYAESIGCNDGQSGWFGDDAPPECAAIEGRISRMQDNLDQLQAHIQHHPNDDGGQRARLMARYNASCSGGNPADLSQDRDSSLYGAPGGNPSDQAAPVNPDDLSTVPPGGDILDEPKAHTESKAICVRTCDGGYFPITDRAPDDQLQNLDQLCRASCPNTEARLYTMAAGGDLASATAVDGGASYTALPTAFKFQKSFDATCTCKPPNQTWVQALAGAEKLLGAAGHGDVTVTAEMSDKLAKPLAPPEPRGKHTAHKSAARSKRAKDAAKPLDAGASAELRATQAPAPGAELGR